MSQNLTHKVHVSPSYNHIRPASNRDYGIAACRIFFYVIGPAGAVQWQISTDWYTDGATRHLERFRGLRPDIRLPPRLERQPQAWDLGYHSRTPRWDGQTAMDSCALLDPDPCYYDGSSLNAEQLVEGFRAGGTDWLWPKLEEYYRSVFEDGPWPDFSPTYQPHPDDGLTEEEYK